MKKKQNQNKSKIKPKIKNGITFVSEKFQGVQRYTIQLPTQNILIEINEASYKSISLFNGKHTLENICKIITNEYEVEKDIVFNDLLNIYDKMNSIGLIE